MINFPKYSGDARGLSRRTFRKFSKFVNVYSIYYSKKSLRKNDEKRRERQEVLTFMKKECNI